MGEEAGVVVSPASEKLAHPQHHNFPWRVALSLVTVFIAASWATFILYFPPVKKDRISPTTPAAFDTVALANSVTTQCAMGMKEDTIVEVNASLKKFFGGIKAGSQVTTTQVGNISDKIVATEQGTALYRAYAECLKLQMSLSLARNGVNVVVPDPREIEADKDEKIRQAISEINLETPREKLIEIFGQPTSISKVDGPGNMSVQTYRYKYSAFAYDYRSGSNRLAIVLSTKDPLQGDAMLFDQIADVHIDKAYSECGGITMSEHQNARSKVCGSSHATDFLSTIYIFPVARVTGLRKEVRSSACNQEIPDWKNCPGFASAPALAVVQIRNPAQSNAVDAKLARVADAFVDYLDFGGLGMALRSPQEAADLEAKQNSQANYTTAQSEAADDQDAEECGRRYKALLH